MEEEFRLILTDDTDTSALVPTARINWGEHPQGAAAPYIVLYVVSNADDLIMQGPSGLWQGRVQVDCYAPSYGAVKPIERAVRAALHGYRAGGFRLIQHVSTRDGREGGTNEADRLFRVGMDFLTSWSALDGTEGFFG